MDIAALIDHRGSIPDIGLGAYETVEVAADVMRVREAIWIESDLVQTLPGRYLKDFQRRIQALYADIRPPRNRRLLVARKGPTRRIRNIQEVENYLTKDGFETVYLEGMSVREQILLFQSAEFIISPHGAGLANLVFCEPGTKVIELMPVSEFRPFFWLISEKLGLVHGLQFSSLVGKREFQSDIQVDIGRLFGLISKVEARDARRYIG
jgi:capsular polysaccharide biosynthesis protein